MRLKEAETPFNPKTRPLLMAGKSNESAKQPMASYRTPLPCGLRQPAEQARCRGVIHP